ncbi:Predicted unusual protein kinase regulating ubiquinone biosynthesis, AarF/ABC1/UbiB family [Nitrosomonas eutropha]|uniref:AarF/UbiB family protein n=1 Tax=Nitrosomonas eutropha TaxID=916 RepID=UPI000890A4FF|nr:AarF/UbiB family protein [Nitrosomonas eutropha]SCX19399.1 Predicted unusual protein kinase regulating ubiquinone biosynthesis, AarF/ABC1/UbiB family [Nitrosomonas eutropha]
MKNHLESKVIKRVMVGTDRSEAADRAVQWAAGFADRYNAELFAVEVVVPQYPSATEFGEAEQTRAAAANNDLAHFVRQVAGDRGHALVVIDTDPALAIVRAAEQKAVDVLVVGNFGMAGRKKFLLGNIPNRISHSAHCTVIIVNTAHSTGEQTSGLARTHLSEGEIPPFEPRLAARATHIAAVIAKHGLKLFGQSNEPDISIRRQQAKRLRAALEELGPIFSKLGQVLSTRPDLLPIEYIEELSLLQSRVPPMTESEVVQVSEQELRVPWEDVFKSIDPKPLAAGTIAQVHRATLESGERVVVKVQRPTARTDIEQDLALLQVFVKKVGKRPALNQVIDMEAVFKHLSTSLHSELDFRQEADNIERMQVVLADYNRLAVPSVHRDLSTSRLLVMEEIQGIPIRQAPAGPARIQAARQLLESYYKQIIVDGFFHADPHPGNLMWWKDCIYFLDFGMVGVVGTDLREHLLLMLMALWQEDAAFLTDVTFMMTSADNSSTLDVARFQSEIGEVMAKYRTASLAEMQIGPLLQEMSAVSLRHGVPLPASLTLAIKALAQVQLATAELDPALDPYDVAGKYLMRLMAKRMGTAFNPKTLLYQSQKLKVRTLRMIEAVENFVGARPGGPKLVVNFRANSLEDIVRHTGRRLALGLTAAASILASGFTAASTVTAEWVPITFGIVGGLLTLGLVIDLLQRH